MSVRVIEPVNCICGRKTFVSEVIGGFWTVCCTRTKDYEVYADGSHEVTQYCWAGPMRKKRADAIKAWNRVMSDDG